MTVCLQRQGYQIGHNRVRRLLRVMGLEAIYPKPRLSMPGGPEHRIYPYRLRGLRIERPNQVWSADITYLRLTQGFVYLVAILDWFSRYVLSWSLSTTLDGWFCVQALREALRTARPEIFNTDQGSQFTSGAWLAELTAAGVTISMDGCGRAFDNIFTERLWRQGQRTLSSFSGKDLHHEVGAPARHATLHDVALFARMLLDQAEGQAA